MKSVFVNRENSISLHWESILIWLVFTIIQKDLIATVWGAPVETAEVAIQLHGLLAKF